MENLLTRAFQLAQTGWNVRLISQEYSCDINHLIDFGQNLPEVFDWTQRLAVVATFSEFNFTIKFGDLTVINSSIWAN